MLVAIVLSCPRCAAQAPPYPWRRHLFSPYVRSALTLPIGERSGFGGDLSGGLAYTPLGRPSLPIPGMGGRLGGGYRYTPSGDTPTDDGAVAVPYFGAAVTYETDIGRFVALAPAIGFNFAVPIEDDTAAPTAEFTMETTAYLRPLSGRRLSIHVGLTLPFTGPAPPTLAIGLGLARRHVAMAPFAEPSVTLATTTPRFSPDGDGEDDRLTIEIGTSDPRTIAAWELRIFDPRDHLFWERSGEGAPPALITWDGRAADGELVSSASDYTIELRITDLVGRSARAWTTILVDVLVIKENGRYFIRIPSITFPPDSADLSLVEDEAAVERNRQVVERLTEIFHTFPEYEIAIEGHANMQFYADPERGAREQIEELIPLSEARAQAVAERLVVAGIAPERITATGVGAARPLVPFSDAENRWKNRRVEFILIEPETPAR